MSQYQFAGIPQWRWQRGINWTVCTVIVFLVAVDVALYVRLSEWKEQTEENARYNQALMDVYKKSQSEYIQMLRLRMTKDSLEIVRLKAESRKR